MTPTTQTKGTRQAWTVACKDAGLDCSFVLTDHNQDELYNLGAQHLKAAHGKSMTKQECLGMAKTTKW
ncbi:MAG: DUF1059 domain-containing protein [Euryarchaeota archaeon]|nr:DUF1059 domain-containing protein [Euryarchaeota archaeon]